MNKLRELENELTKLIEKYDIDEMIDCDAVIIAKNTTTIWGCIKNIKSSSGVKAAAKT